MSKINLGVIGTSKIAQDHIKILKDLDEINLYGITSKTNKFSNVIKSKYKFNKIYDNYLEMVKDQSIIINS